MQARERFRTFLSGDAAQPPFPVDATALAAALAQVPEGEMLVDPNLFARSFLECATVCGLESLLIAVPEDLALPVVNGRDPADEPALAALREGLARLRANAQDRLALAALLPGPSTLCRTRRSNVTVDALEDTVSGLLRLQEYLDPPTLDAIAVLERSELRPSEHADIRDALATLWNVARYYAIPSMFLAADGGIELAQIGADAVVVWQGATPTELLAEGARRVGIPVADPATFPALLPSGFFTSAGAVPATWDVSTVRRLVERATGAQQPK
jgi:hypothetical protein